MARVAAAVRTGKNGIEASDGNPVRAVISQDSYGLLNLNAQLDFANGFGIEAYISNALDEEYLIDAGNTGDAFGIPTFIPGAPQFYGVRLSKSF